MSAKKCGEPMFPKYGENPSTIMESGPLTPEIIDAAAKRALEQFGRPDNNEIPRIISYKADKLLKRIQLKEPGWDDWCYASQIYVKARKMGLIDE